MPNPLDWFNDSRYGLFVHWGPYSVAGRGEWAANRERIPFDEYREKYAANFRAEAYDPADWARKARRWGMKYAVLTTRHHDGFCLWDTRTTDFRATKLGPMRDLVAPFAQAMRAEGIKVGFYYSVADWYHPDYPAAFARDWPQTWPDETARQRFVAFYHRQLEELMTQYGTVDVLWYDGCIPNPTDGAAINTKIKQWQPNILINERNGAPFDFKCTEQSLKEKEGPWEACLTLNHNWGYHAGDAQWKSPWEVINMLVTTASKAGNLLLNVGPRADGTIPEQSVQILDAAGAWLARNREFLHNTTRAPFGWTNAAKFTTRGNSVWVHIFDHPGDEYCCGEIGNKVLSATQIDTGRRLAFEQRPDGRLFLRGLPATPDPIATTIRLDLDGEPRPFSRQETHWIPD